MRSGWLDAAAWRDRLIGADLDLGALRLATRSTLATALTAWSSSKVAAALGLPPTVTLVGAALALMATLVVTDATRRAQWGTYLLLPAPAIASLTVGTLAAGNALLAVTLFVATIFLSVYVRRYGPRGTAAGMIAFNAFFFSLFFHAKPAELTWMFAAAVLGIGISFAIRYGLIRDHKPTMIRRGVAAFRARGAVALWHASQVAQGSWDGRPVARFRSALATLNEGALELEELVRGAADHEVPGERPVLLSRIFAVELAIGRIAAAVREISRESVVSAETRDLIASALLESRRTLQSAQESDARRRMSLACELAASEPNPRGAVLVARLAVAVEDLLEAERGPVHAGFVAAVLAREITGDPVRSDATAPSAHSEPQQGRIADVEPGAEAAALPASPRTVASPQPPARTASGAASLASASPPREWHPMTRQAIQAAVASAVAMLVGDQIAPGRGSWAALAAFIVLTRATTASEIAVRAWHRVLGTVAGVFFGILLAALVHGHHNLELAAMFACIFAGLYILKWSYAWMVLWFTALVAILYDLLGFAGHQLLYIRIAETLAGAISGALAAAFILPTHSRGKISDAVVATLDAVSESLEHLSEHGPTPQLAPRARAVDVRLRDLRAAAEPLTRRAIPIARETVQLVHFTTTLAFYTRQLGRSSTPLSAEGTAAVRAVTSRLRESVQRLSLAVRGEKETPPPVSVLAEIQALPQEAALLAHWLQRLDETITDIDGLIRQQEPGARGAAPQLHPDSGARS